MQRYDVLVVGAGPAGLAFALCLPWGRSFPAAACRSIRRGTAAPAIRQATERRRRWLTPLGADPGRPLPRGGRRPSLPSGSGSLRLNRHRGAWTPARRRTPGSALV